MDLRERVVGFVQSGGSKAEAARRFGVNPQTVYNWLNRKNLAPTVVVRRRRKLDWDALRRDVAAKPDALLRERAEVFGVRVSSIGYALGQMKLTHKKRHSVTRKETRKNA